MSQLQLLVVDKIVNITKMYRITNYYVHKIYRITNLLRTFLANAIASLNSFKFIQQSAILL